MIWHVLLSNIILWSWILSWFGGRKRCFGSPFSYFRENQGRFFKNTFDNKGLGGYVKAFSL